ncbi:MAG: hypothetical protein L3K07_08220 [Thermoplasmata archaeon]|nr:hypothetical protein [Thermoplasmata archaeon]
MPGADRIDLPEAPTEEPTESPGELENRGGVARAGRVFLLYLGCLLLLFGAFIGAQLSSPYPGVRDNLLGTGALALIALLAALGGYAVTMGRAPRTLRVEPGSVVIVERWGRERRLPQAAAAAPASVKAHPPFLLAPDWTETVELAWPGGARRAYLLERGLLARAAAQSELQR